MPVRGTFSSLAIHNYRVWAIGALVSNVGTWMQRIGQDWLVLVVLTDNNATAMGIVMALQFGPPLLLLPLTGWAADHLDRRRLLLFTQGAAGLLALGLGVVTLLGVVELWQVYGFAFLLGCVTAFDAPARQAFVSDLVDDAHLANAVALNSTSFNAARMLGPAVRAGCSWSTQAPTQRCWCRWASCACTSCMRTSARTARAAACLPASATSGGGPT